MNAKAAAVDTNAAPPRRRFAIPDWVFTFSAWVALVLVTLAAVAFSPRRNGEIVFLGGNNLLNIVRAVSETGILAIGMTFVILVGGIDLSVGAILGLAAVDVAVLMTVNGLGVAPAIGLILVIGLLFGLLQGVVSARLGVQAFVVTLAGMQVARGLARIWSGGQGVPLAYGSSGPGTAPEAFALLNSRAFGGTVPIPALIFVAVAVIAVLIMRYSVFAGHVYAVGGNPRAARLSGIAVTRIKVAVYGIAGLLAALAGIIHAGQLNQGSPNDGTGYELDAIAAVVIGGTSLMGGVGSMAGTLAGALLLGVLNNILALNNVDSNIQLLVKGVIIVAAASVQTLRSRSS